MKIRVLKNRNNENNRNRWKILRIEKIVKLEKIIKKIILTLSRQLLNVLINVYYYQKP